MPSPVAKKDVEYQYYTRKLAAASITVPATMPLADLRKTWQSHVINKTNEQMTASDIEWNWLGTFSGVNGTTLRDRWEQAFAQVAGGVKVPSTMEELQTLFYTFAP